MKTFYNIIDKMYGYLNGTQHINTVTTGDVMDIDLNKHTIFPLAHIDVREVTFSEYIMSISINVKVLDIVDENKEDARSLSKPHLSEDNRHDILNTMLTVINGLQSSLRRGGLYDDNYVLEDDATATVIEDQFEHKLTGWNMDLQITVPNNDMGLIESDGSQC